MALAFVHSSYQSTRQSDRGVDFDLKKMGSQIASGANELPEYRTVEDLQNWMDKKRMERRLARTKKEI